MIYADNNATTACLPEVVEAVSNCLRDNYGNPSSRHYIEGRNAAAALDTARQTLSSFLNTELDEIFFTSGATEALNQIIFGVAERLLSKRPHIIAAATEHPAVLEPIERCKRAGARVTLIGVDKNGLINFDELEQALDDSCCLVAVMLANNETGVINDIQRISALAHQHGALMLSDITAALGKIPVDVKALGCDFAACSSHKIYGPKGSGLLYKKRGLAIDPLFYGGHQEQQVRSGTENIPGIVGFSTAVASIQKNQAKHHDHLNKLQSTLEEKIIKDIPGLVIHGAAAPRTPGCNFLSVPGLQRGWLTQLKSVAASSGSSCSSGTGEGSHVLLAMGVAPQDAANSIRVSLGYFNTIEDVDVIAAELTAGAQRLQEQ